VYGTADSILTAVLVVWIVYQAVIIVGILVKDVVFGHIAQDRDETTKSAIHLIANLAKGIIWVFGILLVMSNFGINVTSLMAGAGIAGIAVAFALQGILSDLFSSFSIYFDKPFNVGDFIKTGDSMGTVRHIGIKSTRVLALTGEEIVLSNQELTSAKIQNFGLMEERRVMIHFGVVYETPVEKLKKIPDIVKKIIETLDDTRFDRSHFMSFGDSSLNFETVYYILSSDYNVHMDRQQEIILAIVKRFEEEGISFAYPTRTILYSKK
jgi:small-conductance mechanosensitive channel